MELSLYYSRVNFQGGLDEWAIFVLYVMVHNTISEFEVLMLVTMYYRVFKCDAM